MKKIFLIFIIIFLLSINCVSAWWNTSWTGRINVSINSSLIKPQLNYPVSVNISYLTGMNITKPFIDLRVLNDTNEIPFWIERNISSKWAWVWFSVPYFDASSTKNITISIYYNNPQIDFSNQNGFGVFLFFDDFNDNSLNATKWLTNGATIEESNGRLRVASVTGDVEGKVPYGYINTSLRYFLNQSGAVGGHGYYNDLDNIRAFFQPSIGQIHTSEGIGSCTIPYATANLATNHFTVFDIWRNGTTRVDFYQNDTWSIKCDANIGVGLSPIRLFSNANTLELDWALMRNASYPDARTSIISTEVFSTTTTIPHLSNVDYCQVLWAETNAKKMSNDNWCISNYTLVHNITYQLTIDDNQSTIITYVQEDCINGCDNSTSSCKSTIIYQNVYYFLIIIGIIIMIGIVIKLYARF